MARISVRGVRVDVAGEGGGHKGEESERNLIKTTTKDG